MIQRYRLLLTSLILTFIVVTSRFFYWQIIKSSDLKEKALSQTYKLETENPSRGQILSSDDSPLALNQTNYRVSIYKPNLQEDLNSLFQKIDLIHPNFIAENQKIIDNQ